MMAQRQRRDSNASQRGERAFGLAFARAWRERTRAEFDAIFGSGSACPTCGRVPSSGMRAIIKGDG
jgi:hypothetical protein